MAVDNDRERQLAAAAWILGWIGGPLPALIMLLATGDRTWSRRYMVGAAVFWTGAVVVFAVLLGLAAGTGGAATTVAFVGAVLAALGVTAAAAMAAARRSRREAAP